jgi:mannose-6-phosphate isomerase-like protein (cupin superfamily)
MPDALLAVFNGYALVGLWGHLRHFPPPTVTGGTMTSEFPSVAEYSAEQAKFAGLEVLDIQALQAAVTESYKNQVLLNVNADCLRMAVFEEEYRWHYHPDSDELFLVVAGELHIDFYDRGEVVLRPWQVLVVPRGVAHRTRAAGRTVNLTVERQSAQVVFVEPPPDSSPKPTLLRGAA